MKTTDLKNEFIELRAKNYSFDKIADKIGVSKPTLIDWSKEYNHEISNLKAIELEALREKYYMQKVQKLEVFGEHLDKLKGEIEARLEEGLTDMKTGELFEIYFEYIERFEEELPPIKFILEVDNEDFSIDDLLTRIEQFEAH